MPGENTLLAIHMRTPMEIQNRLNTYVSESKRDGRNHEEGVVLKAAIDELRWILLQGRG